MLHDYSPHFPIDATFLRWLICPPVNLHAETTKTIGGNPVLFALEEICGKGLSVTNLVPRMPSVLPKLLSGLQNANTSASELTQAIGVDSSLVAEVLSEVNSSYYSPTKKVNRLNEAVIILGNLGLHAIVAKAVMRPIFNFQAGKLANRTAVQIWEQSEKCARACSHLSGPCGANPFEAFLAGLVKNLGVTVGIRVIDMTLKELGPPNSLEFCNSVNTKMLKLSELVAEHWHLPEAVICAIRELNQFDSNQQQRSPLGMALFMADRCSKMAMLANGGLISDDEVRAIGLSDIELLCYQKLKEPVRPPLS